MTIMSHNFIFFGKACLKHTSYPIFQIFYKLQNNVCYVFNCRKVYCILRANSDSANIPMYGICAFVVKCNYKEFQNWIIERFLKLEKSKER